MRIILWTWSIELCVRLRRRQIAKAAARRSLSRHLAIPDATNPTTGVDDGRAVLKLKSTSSWTRHSGALASAKPPLYVAIMLVVSTQNLAAGLLDHNEISTPTEFAPAPISETAQKVSTSSPAFFPDGRSLLFERGIGKTRFLYFTRAPFSGRWLDFEPAVATDGSYIVFTSARPRTKGGEVLEGHWKGKDYPGAGGNLWIVRRTKSGGWSSPRLLPETVNHGTSVYEPALATDGTLYFMRSDSRDDTFHLFCAKRRGNSYAPAEPIPLEGVDPAIAPDQSYIVYASSIRTPGQMSLYISLRRHEQWSQPSRLPDAVNRSVSSKDVHLSPDQKTLYFTRGDFIWQVPFQPILQWAQRTMSG